MLEAIDSKLDAMEAQNQERFKLTMQAMKYSYDELNAQIETSTAGITQQLQKLHSHKHSENFEHNISSLAFQLTIFRVWV